MKLEIEKLGQGKRIQTNMGILKFNAAAVTELEFGLDFLTAKVRGKCD